MFITCLSGNARLDELDTHISLENFICSVEFDTTVQPFTFLSFSKCVNLVHYLIFLHFHILMCELGIIILTMLIIKYQH
jgi:hypothetical protein